MLTSLRRRTDERVAELGGALHPLRAFSGIHSPPSRSDGSRYPSSGRQWLCVFLAETGWANGQDPTLWSVQDGVLTGRLMEPQDESIPRGRVHQS